MKNIFLLLALFIMADSFGQGRQRKSPHDTLAYSNGEIIYGRPYKSGREIFGVLEKYGNIWRVGSDEATTISFKKDVKFGDQLVPAGTYTLFAKIDEDEWTVILNTQLGQWGAFSYEKNKDKDVAKVKVPVEKLNDVVEQLTIWYDDDNSKLVIKWDLTKVSVPLTF